MDKLEKLKKEREELDKRIETLEYAERMFEEGDEIYHIDEYGNVNSGNWGNHAWIDGSFSQGHIFRTKQEAETEANKRNLLTRFSAFKNECNDGWEADFKNFSERKYFIVYGGGSENIFITCKNEYDYFNLFGYFKSESDARKAIELFGDEIKELFVDSISN